MKVRLLMVWVGPLLLATACVHPVVKPLAIPGEERTEVILAAFEQMTGAPLWPGFEPRAAPLAIYDGARTWLYRHPRPPGEFRAVRPQLAMVEGQHRAIRANSGVELDGVLTASIRLEPDLASRLAAATAVHETFHVFEQRQHADWAANELDGFAYPDADRPTAELRYLEDATLESALEAHVRGNLDDCRCATESALELRARRALALPAAAMTYERAVERYEGLAQYVEYLAFGRTPPWPHSELTPDQIRRRAYFSGQAWALLLDAHAPGWQTRFGSLQPPQALDLLLRQVLSTGKPCPLRGNSANEARRRAGRDVHALIVRRSARDRELGARSGSWLVIEAGSEPLWPQGFDPWNIERLSAGRLAHSQRLKLGNATGSIEILARASMTEGVSAHPLAGGIRRLVVPDFDVRRTVTRDGGVVVIDGDGVRGRLRVSSVAEEGAGIRVKLP